MFSSRSYAVAHEQAPKTRNERPQDPAGEQGEQIPAKARLAPPNQIHAQRKKEEPSQFPLTGAGNSASSVSGSTIGCHICNAGKVDKNHRTDPM